MSFLLDSNAFLSWTTGARMDRTARARIEHAPVSVSAVTAFELGQKQLLGKLRLTTSVRDDAARHGFTALPITMEHAERAARLPLLHRDPFDRMLIAQAQLERLTIVTRDEIFDAYDVDVLRC